MAVLGRFNPIVEPAPLPGVFNKSFCCWLSDPSPRPPAGLDFNPVWILEVAGVFLGVAVVLDAAEEGRDNPNVFFG